MGGWKRLVIVGVVVGLALAPGVAAACRVCDEGTGQAVGGGILDEELPGIAAITALPFGILLSTAVVLHAGLSEPAPVRRTRKRGQS